MARPQGLHPVVGMVVCSGIDAPVAVVPHPRHGVNNVDKMDTSPAKVVSRIA